MSDDPADRPAEEAIAAEIRARFYQLDPISLPDTERERLGQGTFVGVAPLVLTVAACLADHPHLFPGGPAVAAALRGRQRRAWFWLSLSVQLEHLARMARDTYLSEQGQAFLSAMAPIRKLRYDAADPTLSPGDRGPGSALQERIRALWPALHILRRVRGGRAARSSNTGRPRPSKNALMEQLRGLRLRLSKKS
jgi:hypothetical protein